MPLSSNDLAPFQANPIAVFRITRLTIEKDRNPDWRKIKIRNGQIVRQ